MAQFNEVLRGFDSRWCHWNFSLTKFFRPHYGPGVDSTSNRNEYQRYFLGSKGDRCIGLTTLRPSCADFLEIWELQPLENLRACKRPVQGFAFLLHLPSFLKGPEPRNLLQNILKHIRPCGSVSIVTRLQAGWPRNICSVTGCGKSFISPSNLTDHLNPLTPNDPYRRRTAPLTSKRCILYIYSTNIGTEYFKHDIYSPFFSLQIAVCFIILTYLVPVLFTFYIYRVC